MAYSLKLSPSAVSKLISVTEAADDPLPHGSSEPTTTVYVLGLKPEGMGRHHPRGWKHRVAQFAAKHLQPGRPVYAHCELLLPIAGRPGIFSTYSNGGGADWRHPTPEETSYYVIENAALWHAVPIRVPVSEAIRMQDTANEARGAPYSFRRYMLAARGVRKLAWLFKQGGSTPGHCGNITARVIKGGTGERLLSHAEGYFGPSALMAELHAKLARGPLAGIASATKLSADSVVIHGKASNRLQFHEFSAIAIDPELADESTTEEARVAAQTYQLALADNVLLYGSDKDVDSTPSMHKEVVLEMLADQVLNAATTGERQLHEQLLARALLRARLL